MSIDAVNSTNSQYLQYAMLGSTGTKPPKPPDVSEIISNQDTDGDGSLSLEEFGSSEKSKKLFSKIDEDSDGLLTSEELQSHFDSKKAKMESLASQNSLSALINQSGLNLPDATEMIANRDEDGDGNLSSEEFDVSEEVFSSIDTDGDGVISAEELQSDMENRATEMQSQMMQGMGMPPPPPSAEDMISQKDEDGDGGLSIEELGESEETFSSIDTDGDGVISAEELQAYMDKNAEETQSQMSSYQGLNSESLSSLLSQLDSDQTSTDSLQSLLKYLATSETSNSTNNYQALKNYTGVDLIA